MRGYREEEEDRGGGQRGEARGVRVVVAKEAGSRSRPLAGGEKERRHEEVEEVCCVGGEREGERQRDRRREGRPSVVGARSARRATGSDVGGGGKAKKKWNGSSKKAQKCIVPEW